MKLLIYINNQSELSVQKYRIISNKGAFLIYSLLGPQYNFILSIIKHSLALELFLGAPKLEIIR